ncbi:hypothetical protein K1T71_008841 [Dendrolimus kikuchii]|uniref:Uncharacterized protein n=1 Tax=Dendrolimus kikuchii TaxID=765133 RepID=A0ACC1CVQ6_9NEOP|nr:hypothetical protein K1T71_008841 [Dendrolimus kikuchii]
MSSAYNRIVEFLKQSVTSVIKILKSMGPRMDPCGTPEGINFHNDAFPYDADRLYRNARKNKAFSYDIRFMWTLLSKNN